MLGAATVILDDAGRVLLVKHSYGERNWQIPGGGGESGESAEETARREAREEVGIDLDIDRLVGVYWELPDDHHFVFRARALGEPQVTDLDEITELGWFSPDALPRPISDFTVRRITDAIAGGPAGVWKIGGPRVWLR
jgi:8-oxo-dGTP pyrophosphatase MutT (NUDIX family)